MSVAVEAAVILLWADSVTSLVVIAVSAAAVMTDLPGARPIRKLIQLGEGLPTRRLLASYARC